MAKDSRKPMSWKNPGGGNGPPPSQKREWHPSAAPAARAAGPRRRSLLLPALAGAVLLGLIVAAILLWRPAHPPHINIIAPPNAGTLAVPPGVAHAGGARAMVDWLKDGKDRPRLDHEPVESVAGDEWERGLADFKEDSVVIYLGLHGSVDADGEPFLWLAPPTATEPGDKYKLRLSNVLSRINQLVPAAKSKLLILDATQVPVSYVQGQLHNDFARALKKIEAKIVQVPNLVVLCSSDEDQRSWVSEEWQRPIFTHLLVEGARGAAGVDRVTVDKLVEYLQRAVPAWTLANRGEEQTPFLLPKAGGMKMAQKIELASVTSKDYAPPSSLQAPGAKFEAPKALRDAWARREDLSQRVPPPEAIAPYQWRRHLDMLLRIEQMLRAGLPSADGQALLNGAARDEALLAGGPSKLTCLGNSLALPAAVGVPLDRSKLEAREFEKLWSNPAAQWPLLQPVLGPRGELIVCAELLDHLERTDRSENVAAAARVLDIIFGRSALAPVEIHLIRLWARDLDDRRPAWPILKLALQTQRLAEGIALTGGAGPAEYPAGEQIFPWIREAVAAADIERLRGLDLLLSNQPADWQTAEARLQEARKQYEAIRERARMVRAALAARNSALAELPYYGRWAAGLRDEFNERERERLLALVESTAEAAHNLSDLLEEANPARLGELNGAANVAAAGLKNLRDTFFDFIKTLNGRELYGQWHQIDNALQVPFIPAKQRGELLVFLRGISSALNAKSESVSAEAVGKSGFDALAAAQRHGRVALALLGAKRVNDAQTRAESGGAITANFEEIRQLIAGKTPETLHKAGDQIGRHWRALAGRTDALTEKAARDPLERAAVELTQADTMARSLDSATLLTRDPVADNRRYRLHTFLLDQARRTIAANWGALESAAPRSYAEETALLFVNDARQLILAGAGPGASPDDRARLLADVRRIQPADDALNIPRLAIAPRDRNIDLTELQKRFHTTFTMLRPAGQPAGFPVLRFASSGPARVSLAASSGRRPVTNFVQNDVPSVEQVEEIELDLKASAATNGFIQAELWFRGHRLETRVIYDVNREPSRIWIRNPAKGDASFAVRVGPDMRTGSIAFVLDWSKSMNTKDSSGKSRYKQALEELKPVLLKLPPGTMIAIRQFGTPDSTSRARPIVRPPQKYDFKNRPRDLEELMEQLETNEPAGEDTPLAQAIKTAAKKDIDEDFVGYKAMVVLTDGDDNVDGARSGQVVYDALGTSGIALHMIFFNATRTESDNARVQFDRIQQLEPPGQFYDANSPGELKAALLEAMLPRVRTFNVRDNVAAAVAGEKAGLKVTLHGSNLDNWIEPPLKPGSYKLRALDAKAEISLSAGDRLLLELARGNQKVEFRPRLFIPEAIRPGNNLQAATKDKWGLHAGIGNLQLVEREGRDGGYDLDMLLFVERERRPDELQVTYPKFIWVEVRPQQDPGGPALTARLENEPYYPAPAYRLRVWNWPAAAPGQNVRQNPALPLVTVWWRDSFPGDFQLVPIDPNKSDAENFGKPLNLDGKNVRIESLTMDGRYLRLQASYSPSGPAHFFVRPEKLRKDSREPLEEHHRYYEKTGKYTATFGPLSDDEQRSAYNLVFYSMTALKDNDSSGKIELRPTVPLDVNGFGQDVPRKKEFR